MTLQRFYLTFGVQYPAVPHPHWAGANKDGWVLIEARDEPEARIIANRYFGKVWSMIYPAQYFPEQLNKLRYYPLGQIARLSLNEPYSDGPEPLFTTSDPRWYGVDPNSVVAARVEGIREWDGDEPSHEVEYFHRHCVDAGKALFSDVDEVDHSVLALELDWAQPYHCEVCEESIT